VFENFYFARFSFVLEALDEMRLPPYKGSTLRGGFGHVFRKVVCTIRTSDCDECILAPRCVYAYIFETKPFEGTEALRLYRRVPHPFVLEPPLETKTTYAPGETLTFGLVLIGRAVDYLPYFVYTFEELGKIGIGKGRGRYRLREVRRHDGTVIYRGDEKVLGGGDGYGAGVARERGEGGEKDEAGRVSLRLLSPLRLKSKGRLVSTPEFHHIARALLRRLSTLAYFHCGIKPELDFRGLIERAEEVRTAASETRWVDWERYSSRQKTRMKMGGIVGEVTFAGALEEFMPLLRLGEAIHVGKGTAFGLGRYRVEIP